METDTYYTYIIATQSALYMRYNRNVNTAYGSLEKGEFHLTDMRGGLLGPAGTWVALTQTGRAVEAGPGARGLVEGRCGEREGRTG